MPLKQTTTDPAAARRIVSCPKRTSATRIMDSPPQATEQLQTLMDLEQRHEELLDQLEQLDRRVSVALEEYRREWRVPERFP